MKSSPFKLLLGILFLLLASSCTTQEKFSMSAPTNLEIDAPNGNFLANINHTSQTEIKLPSDAYYGYLLTNDPITGLNVPIGLNVKTKKHPWEKFSIGTGYTLVGVGLVSELVALSLVIGGEANDDDEISALGGITCAIGTGLGGLGVGIGLSADIRSDQIAHLYNFTYDSHQYVEIPELSPTLINPDPSKGVIIDTPKLSKLKPSKNTSKSDSQTGTLTLKKNKTNIAKGVVGEYIGNGKLTLKTSTEEIYDNVVILIEQIDKSKISLRIIEDDEDFFDEPLICNVTGNAKAGYKLTWDKSSNVTINISKTGAISFIHPKIKIDNTIYTLSINAKKTAK